MGTCSLGVAIHSQHHGQTIHPTEKCLHDNIGLKNKSASEEKKCFLVLNIILYIIIFLSERQHYVTFHPLGILRYHWSLMFTFLFTFLFTWNVAGDLKFKFGLCLMKSIEFKNEKKKTWEFKMALAPLCITYSIIKWMQRS